MKSAINTAKLKISKIQKAHTVEQQYAGGSLHRACSSGTALLINLELQSLITTLKTAAHTPDQATHCTSPPYHRTNFYCSVQCHQIYTVTGVDVKEKYHTSYSVGVGYTVSSGVTQRVGAPGQISHTLSLSQGPQSPIVFQNCGAHWDPLNPRIPWPAASLA